jgi:hypothetical protein
LGFRGSRRKGGTGDLDEGKKRRREDMSEHDNRE